MAKTKGKQVYVSVKANGGYTKVGGQKDATLDFAQDVSESTSKDSDTWKEKELGFREMSVSFDAFLIEDDAGWLLLKKGLISLAADHEKVELQIDTVSYKYTGKFVMSGLSMAGPLADLSSVSFTLTSDGAVTEVAK